MTCYFAGGASGSALAGVVHAHAGWNGVGTLGAGPSLLLCLAGAADAPGVRGWRRRQSRLQDPWAVASAGLLGMAALALVALVIRVLT